MKAMIYNLKQYLVLEVRFIAAFVFLIYCQRCCRLCEHFPCHKIQACGMRQPGRELPGTEQVPPSDPTYLGNTLQLVLP